MSDVEYDQVLEGLPSSEPTPKKATRRPPGSRQKAEKPPRTKRPEGTSKQFGRRADKESTQVNASIRKELKPSLFYYLKEDGISLQELIEKSVEAYVEERGGIIGKRRRKA